MTSSQPVSARAFIVGLLAVLLPSVLVSAASVRAQELVVRPVRALVNPSTILSIPIYIRGPITLSAFGFDVTPGSIDPFSYNYFQRGALFAGWQALSARARTGALRVGGYDPNPVFVEGEQPLCFIGFVRTSAGCTELSLGNFIDDLEPLLPPSAAQILWEIPSSHEYEQGTIGVYGDEAATECCLQIGSAATLYVVARLNNDSMQGIEEAEFRIEIEPPAPQAEFTFQPSNLVSSAVGNPVQNSAEDDSAGTHLFFNGCQTSATIVLGTLEVSGLTGAHEVRVRPSKRPLHSRVHCLHFVLCGACELRCLPSINATQRDNILYVSKLNPVSCDEPNCGSVGLAAQTWSDIKRLYH